MQYTTIHVRLHLITKLIKVCALIHELGFPKNFRHARIGMMAEKLFPKNSRAMPPKRLKRQKLILEYYKSNTFLLLVQNKLKTT